MYKISKLAKSYQYIVILSIIERIIKKWKIIERNISTVTNASSEEYGIWHSLHDAYFNLINRWEFEGKI